MQGNSLGTDGAVAVPVVRCRRRLAMFLVTVLGSAGTASADITFGQLDDFEDGTTMGWSHGPISPNPPTNISSGGPNGADDNYLRNVSIGGFGPASRQVMFNQMQWVGDFNTAGVTRVTGHMANFGSTDLHMRIGVQGGPLSSRWASASAITLPVGSGWQSVTFNLTPSAMSLVSGTDSLSTVLGNVNEFRILSAEMPNYMGDIMVSTLGVDNLRALRLPGDANFDGVVNLADFNILAANFGSTSATWQQADFNFDGAVNLADFNLLAANFGQMISGPDVTPQDWSNLASAIPEPASLGGVVLSLAMLGARRRGARVDS